MSEAHKHCWHLLGRDVLETYARVDETCCLCGEDRTRTVYFHSRPTTTKHGQHLPKGAA